MQPISPTQPSTPPVTAPVTGPVGPFPTMAGPAPVFIGQQGFGPPAGMPADPDTAMFLRNVRRRQLIWAVVGGVLALAAVIALLIWPEQVKEGVVQGATALWRLLQMIFGGLTN